MNRIRSSIVVGSIVAGFAAACAGPPPPASPPAGYVMRTMPPGKGGSLRDDEYLAILAFDLQANGVALEQPLDLAGAAKLVIPR